jgi:FKBP-type peptidyl-prolyl cis-trans isomerase
MMKYFLPLFVLLFLTGCLDSGSDPFGEPVDETDFLMENATKPGVTVTNSGLQYRIIDQGDGELPAIGQVVFIDYVGRLVNGQIFSRSDGLEYLSLTQNILPGLYEGLQLMNAGSKYEFVIPSELGFADAPPANTPVRPGSVLIMELTLDSFLLAPDQFLAQNLENEDVTVSDSGLQYRVITEGQGDNATAGSTVRVRYTGTLTNGLQFDRSPGNDTVTFNTSQVIAGFSEGLRLMNRGSKFQLFIPPNLGYGQQPPFGSLIPPNAVLVFEVELVEIL